MKANYHAQDWGAKNEPQVISRTAGAASSSRREQRGLGYVDRTEVRLAAACLAEAGAVAEYAGEPRSFAPGAGGVDDAEVSTPMRRLRGSTTSTSAATRTRSRERERQGRLALEGCDGQSHARVPRSRRSARDAHASAEAVPANDMMIEMLGSELHVAMQRLEHR